jgi:hypothetical protein
MPSFFNVVGWLLGVFSAIVLIALFRSWAKRIGRRHQANRSRRAQADARKKGAQ